MTSQRSEVPGAQVDVVEERIAHPVPYDENLLERARTQWQFGDWDSLARLDRDAIQPHPDRARLALLAAAGRLQMHRADEARQFIRLAHDWGVSKIQLAQILTSGVHNSLGRAAALSNKPKCALRHFNAAIALGTPGADTRLLLQARAGEQLQQLGIDESGLLLCVKPPAHPAPPSPTPIAASIEHLADTLEAQRTELSALLQKEVEELVSLRKDFRANLKTELANAARQIGDFISLQHYFGTGYLSDIRLEMNGWPVSSDYMLYLVKLIDQNDYDLIIEFGSGSSTLAIAKTLANLTSRRQGRPPVGFASFDHLEQYYQQTLAQLEHGGLADFVQLHLSPLDDYAAPNGNIYRYYSCQTVLAELAQNNAFQQLRMLVTVDGPPGNTGKHARYPAVPLVMSLFKWANIDFLMDDAARADEKEIISLWKKDIAVSGLIATEKIIKLEKGASLIRIEGRGDRR